MRTIHRHAKVYAFELAPGVSEVKGALDALFRSLWIVRIGAAARLNGLNYSQFMHGLKLANIELDRKILADLAANQPEGFAELAGQVKTALDNDQQQRAAA